MTANDPTLHAIRRAQLAGIGVAVKRLEHALSGLPNIDIKPRKKKAWTDRDLARAYVELYDDIEHMLAQYEHEHASLFEKAVRELPQPRRKT